MTYKLIFQKNFSVQCTFGLVKDLYLIQLIGNIGELNNFTIEHRLDLSIDESGSEANIKESKNYFRQFLGTTFF